MHDTTDNLSRAYTTQDYYLHDGELVPWPCTWTFDMQRHADGILRYTCTAEVEPGKRDVVHKPVTEAEAARIREGMAYADASPCWQRQTAEA